MMMAMRQNDGECDDDHDDYEDDDQEHHGDDGNIGDADDDPNGDASYDDGDDNAITIMKMPMTRMKMTMTAARSIRMTIFKKIRGRAKRGRRI